MSDSTEQDTAQDTAQDTEQKKEASDKEDMVPRKNLNQVYGELKKWKEKWQSAEQGGLILTPEEKDKIDHVLSDHEKRQQEILEKEGKFTELLERKTAEYKKEIEKEKQNAIRYKASRDEFLIDQQILRAANGKAADPSKIVKLIRGNFQVQEDEVGRPFVAVFDDDGKPAYDDSAKHATLDWFVNKYIEDNPDVQPSTVPKGSGGRSQTGAGRATGLPSVAEMNRMKGPQILELYRKQKAGEI